MYSVKKYIPINLTYIAIVAMFFMNFIKIVFLPYDPIQYACMMIVGLYIVTNLKYIKLRNFGLETVLWLIYAICSLVASKMNIGEVVLMNPIRWATLYAGMMIECYLLIVILLEKGKIDFFIKIFFKYYLAFVLMTDVFVFIGRTFAGQYLIGNKFDVAYLHIIMLLFYYLEMKLYREDYNETTKLTRRLWIGWWLLVALSITAIIKVSCSTGLLGLLLFVILIITHSKRNYILSNRLVVFIACIACMLFPFWYELILTNSYFVYLVEGILHKKLTLTGRTFIYDAALLIIGDGWKTGYGINTNYEICMRFGFVNIQNGFLKLLMEVGIVGWTSIMTLVFASFGKCKNNRKELIAVAAYLFVFIIISSVEITISRSFIFWNLFMFVYARYLNRVDEAELQAASV